MFEVLSYLLRNHYFSPGFDNKNFHLWLLLDEFQDIEPMSSQKEGRIKLR